MMNNIFIKVLSSVFFWYDHINHRHQQFHKALALPVHEHDHMDLTLTINIFMKVLSSFLLMAIAIFTTSQGCSTTPLSAAGDNPWADFCLWELFPWISNIFCFQFLVVGRLCALLDSLLYLTFNLQWKLYWLSWQSFRLIHRARGKFLRL